MCVRYINLFILLLFFDFGFCRISDEKCIEYTEPYLNNKIQINRHTPNEHGKILTSIGEIPHLVILGFENEDNSTNWYDCSGSLISEQFVLTSFTCIRLSHNHPTPVKYAAVGVHDINTLENDGSVQKFEVIEKYYYPEITTNLTFRNYSDIVLLKLDRPVLFNEYIRPACLSTYIKLPNNTEVSAVSLNNYITDVREDTTKIHKVYFDIFVNKSCASIFGSFFQYNFLDNLLICAGGRDSVKNTCSGDDGGPLHLYNEQRNAYKIVGITSFGIRTNCRSLGPTRVYTKVAAYIPWIENIVWPCVDNFRTSEKLNEYINKNGHPPQEQICTKTI